MTNLSAEQGLSFYLQRMKIKQAFRDLKSLLRMDKLMCQNRHWIEQMVALACMASAIGLVLDETFHSHLFPETTRKHKLCFGLFVLLKRKFALSCQAHEQIRLQALPAFKAITLPVRTFV